MLEAKSELNVEHLNELPFPSDYLFNDGNADVVEVNGSKIFAGVLGNIFKFNFSLNFE